MILYYRVTGCKSLERNYSSEFWWIWKVVAVYTYGGLLLAVADGVVKWRFGGVFVYE
jgi:hypothetical protein